MYPLFVDDRAGSQDLLEFLPPPPDTDPCRLEFGDAMIIGNGPTDTVTVGVEVKSVSDLLTSADTGRLAGHQLPGMLALYDVAWLLYFGPYRPGRDRELQVQRRKGATVVWQNYRIGTRPVPYGYLESFLMDVASTGCRIKHVHDASEAAEWLRVAHRWWSKRWSEHKGLRGFDESKSVSLFHGLDPQREMLARAVKVLPGFGVDKAIAASAHFESIAAMAGAEVRDWLEIPGVGKVLAKEAVRAINNR